MKDGILTIGDGFRLGCGMMMASFLGMFLFFIAFLVIMFILTLIGVGSMLPYLPTP